MSRILVAAAALLAWSVQSHAAPPAPEPDAEPGQAAAQGPDPAKHAARRPFETLMFTIDEFNDIQGRIASGTATDTSEGRQAIEDATLYLSTIIYNGPKDWTVWINGAPISPNQDFQAFQVTDISANHVDLLVPLSAQGMRPVRLSPNQTFNTKTGAVVEGRVQ